MSRSVPSVFDRFNLGFSRLTRSELIYGVRIVVGVLRARPRRVCIFGYKGDNVGAFVGRDYAGEFTREHGRCE